MSHRAVIVRYGEISLKGRNRSGFEQRLVNDLAWFLKKHGHAYGKITAERGRISGWRPSRAFSFVERVAVGAP